MQYTTIRLISQDNDNTPITYDLSCQQNVYIPFYWLLKDLQ